MAEAASNLPRLLVELLNDPREDLSVEIKDWLELEKKDVAADLARELLALANHGGGMLLFGFDDTPTGHEPTGACPFSEVGYSQDAINNLCKRFAEPPFHCTVHRVTSALGNAHVVIEVPGGHRVPIRARRGGPEPSKLKANVYYVRRPGPESAPVASGQEWDTLLRRCLSAQREELLDSFRAIVSTLGVGGADALGLGGVQPRPPLELWRDESRERFHELIAKELPDEQPSRYGLGTFSTAYRVVDPVTRPTLQELVAILTEIRAMRRAGLPGVYFRPLSYGRPMTRLSVGLETTASSTTAPIRISGESRPMARRI
jgi:hypothetical protein